MNILLLNHNWLAEELKTFGHRVVTAGIFRPQLDVSFSSAVVTTDELLTAMPSGFIPERIVHYDDSGVPWLVGLERLAIPKIFYSVDTHHHHQWHGFFAAAFDHVLVAQRCYMDIFKDHIGRRTWFPPWAPIDVEPQGERDIPVSFRGNLDPILHPRRAEFFSRLAAAVGGDYGSGDYVSVYSRSKIVVNEAVNSDLNFRVFEAMMCGALLVTPDSSTGLSELFSPEEDLLVYPDGNAEAAAACITRMLENDAERERIAASGRDKVLRFHTTKARAEMLHLTLLVLDSAEQRPAMHFSAAQSYLFSFLVSRAQRLGEHVPMLIAAADSLVESLVQEEPVEEKDSVNVAFLLAAQLRIAEELPSELRLFRTLLERYPESFITAMGVMDVLLIANERETALSLARKFSAEPDALLEQLQQLLAEARHGFA